MVPGRYFDGVSSQGRAAIFTFEGGCLRIGAEGFTRSVPPGQISFAISRGAAPTRLSIVGGALCEMPNSPQSRELVTQLGARTGIADWLEMHRGAVLGTLAVFVALLFVAWRWGIPLAADLIVDRMPESWEKRAGDSVFAELEARGAFEPSELPAARQERIRQRFVALDKSGAAPGPVPAFRIEFRHLGVANAFALPGGTIVVGDELVKLDPGGGAALQTVLGHELGHVVYRHSLRAVVRTTLYSALAAWYFGDVSAFVASAAAGFTALRYSRAAEDEADHYALRLMQQNGISTRDAATLFERLADPSGSRGGRQGNGATEGGLPEYLSTHPDIRSRIALFRGAGATKPTAEARPKPAAAPAAVRH